MLSRCVAIGIIAAAIGLAVAFGCGRAPAPTEPGAAEAIEDPQGPPWFEDITAKSGVDFTHDVGPLDKYLMYQCVGSGVGIHDLDGDGRPDLLFLTNGG